MSKKAQILVPAGVVCSIVALAEVVVRIPGWEFIIYPGGALVCFYILGAGLIWRIGGWVISRQPFKIPLAAGQQTAPTAAKPQPVENPSGRVGAIARVAGEILFFRSLLRNTRPAADGSGYLRSRALWVAAIVMHYSFLVVMIRHHGVVHKTNPGVLMFLPGGGGLGLSTIVLAIALLYLAARRLKQATPVVSSTPADFYHLTLFLAVIATGIYASIFSGATPEQTRSTFMAFATRVFPAPELFSPTFAAHVFIASFFFAGIPYSKLAHSMAAIVSPTRSAANNSRRRRRKVGIEIEDEGGSYSEWEKRFSGRPGPGASAGVEPSAEAGE